MARALSSVQLVKIEASANRCSPAITSSGGTSRSSAGWAVTLTPGGSGWLVWDIEPAGAGNS